MKICRNVSGCLLTVLALLSFPALWLPPAHAYGRTEVCFREKCFDADIAQTGRERMRGLQFQKNLKPGEGMLFVFPQTGMYRFWMKDTLIPLDIIWLDENKRVIYIAENVLPCRQTPCTTYGPGSESRYTLEINAGLAAKLGIRVGDEAAFRLP